jgi:uncharacterized membrane protein
MLTAVFAALYAIFVFMFAGVSFGVFQIRVADALIPLSIVLGWPVVCGVTIGCAIANIVTPLPSIITDMTLGSMANFVASLLAWKISLWKSGRIGDILACLAATLIVTFIVGTYLAVITATDYWLWWTGVGVGSVVSIGILGFVLVSILRGVKFQII